jgi:hypothetical protein
MHGTAFKTNLQSLSFDQKLPSGRQWLMFTVDPPPYLYLESLLV